MSKKKDPIEVRFTIRIDREKDIYEKFVEALNYFKINENMVGKMLFIQGIENWFEKEIKGKE